MNTQTLLPSYSNPFRLLFSRAPWAAFSYIFTYIVLSGFLFTTALVAVIVGGILSVLLIGIPLLIATAIIINSLGAVERWRLKLVQREQEPASNRQVTGKGILNQVKTRWTDPATWRQLLYLILLWPFLLLLNVVAFAILISFLGLVSLPFWYWSSPTEFPNGDRAHGVQLGYFPDGPDASPVGIGLWVGDVPSALLAAAIGVVLLVLIGNYLIVGVARLHAAIARNLVGVYRDPLTDVKTMLNTADPLRIER
jgi:hypothetical protein